MSLSASLASAEEVPLAWLPRASIGAPHFLQGGAEAFYRPDQRAFADAFGVYLPLAGQKSIGLYGLRAGAKWYPWHPKNWFAAASLGYHRGLLSANMSQFQIEGTMIADNGVLDVNAIYFSPHFGIELPLSEKFTCEFDIGLQVPLIAWGSLFVENRSTGANSNNSADLTLKNANYISRIATIPLPEITLFRLKWKL